MTATVSHLICDCDGVLLDSESIALRVLHRELLPRLSKPNRLLANALHDAIAERLGMFTDLLLDDIDALFELGLSAQERARIDAVTGRACSDEALAVPGVAAALRAVPWPKAVASNSGPARIEAGLRRNGLWECFDGRIHSSHTLGRPKPAPDVYLAAIAGFGATPAQCLAVDDSVTGVRSAVAAGVRVYGFVGVAHDRARVGGQLKNAGAELVFDDMEQLPGLLAALSRTR
jgi:HAD superfamily hydrolase (TIGR01509 family)